MTKDELFAIGALKPGQIVQLRRRPDTKAIIVDNKKVKFKGEIMTYTKWVKSITGWQGVNLFRTVELSSGVSLDELRRRSTSL